MTTKEQRSSPRVPLTLQVQYPEQEGFFSDATENLSAGGLFVRTERAFPVGETVPLLLSFPNLLPPLEIVGVVAWVRPKTEKTPAGVGLRIPDDRPTDKQKLADLLAAVRSEKPTRRKFRILIVEDNPHIMEMYEYVMRKLSKGEVAIEVELARDGHDAIEKARTQGFDLVVTDLYMPVLDGFQFIQRLRQVPGKEKVPIIAISAGGADTQAQAEAVGADVFLRKPVRFVDVVETVRSLLKL